MAFRHALFALLPLPRIYRRRVWHPCHTHATLPGGAAVSAAPTEHSCTNIAILPRNSRNTQNLLAVYSPTDCTDFHRCCFQGGALVSSAPTRSVVALLALLMYFLLCWCTSCSVGALETSAPPERTYLCRSVKSVGEYFQQPLP